MVDANLISLKDKTVGEIKETGNRNVNLQQSLLIAIEKTNELLADCKTLLQDIKTNTTPA